MPNNEMNLAWQFIAQTNTSVFLTGKAGTGKTTFLRKLKELTPKRMVVLAPTGVAAINAKGQTIHSFFQLPFGPNLPEMEDNRKWTYKMGKEKKNIIRTLDLLVIDEISMVRCDLLDAIDRELRKYRDRTKPFGGVQLLLIGDLQQLSPVAKDDEWRLLSPYYDSPYFFSSRALKEIQYVTIELKHIYRQTDLQFVNLLAAVRTNQITPDILTQLNSRYIPNFLPPQNEEWIRLTTHNRIAQEYNQHQLDALPDMPKLFKAVIKKNFPESNYPADLNLVLKKGAQVMFIKNDPSTDRLYYNGKMGVVQGYDGETGNIIVYSKESKSTISVPPVTWDNTKYVLDDETHSIREEVEGTFTQYPLRLAWAITVHKSQGLTFDHAIIDISNSFAHGQAYVALSRCRTLQGLILSQPINPNAIITDSTIDEYIDQKTAEAAVASQQLPQLRYNYYFFLLEEMFSFKKFTQDYKYFMRVIGEHLYQSEPELLKSLEDAYPVLDEKIFDVALTFGQQYRTLMQQSANFQTDPLLHQRLTAACGYFGPKLHEIIDPLLADTKLQIGNKTIATQYNNALDAFKLTYKIKVGVFDRLKDDGFSVQSYLSAKAAAALDELQPSKLKKESNTQKSQPKIESNTQIPQPKKENNTHKPQKGDSQRNTLALYRQGKTINEIAALRNLNPTTIESHLASFIPTGEVSIEEFVTPQRQQFIRNTIQAIDHAYTLSEIKALLPDDYTYLEIKIVAQSMKLE